MRAGASSRSRLRRLPGAGAVLLLLAALGMRAEVLAAGVEARVSDARGRPVSSAVLYLESAAGGSLALTPAKIAIIDQINKEFVPRVVVVAAGSRVSFPNRDNIRHHVYSFSPARKFELPLYAGTPSEPVLFEQPGVVTLGCNIHDWMRGYVLVLETPYFAASDADGVVRIDALPPGEYRPLLWHPELRQGAPVAGAPFSVAAEPVRLPDVVLDLKAELRIRRAPAARRGDRY